MKIDNAVALVTGANRGIGLAFTRALLARGARKVYAGARDPSTVTLARRRADPARRDQARRGGRGRRARRRRDARHQQRRRRPARRLSRARTAKTSARRQLETNFFGMLRMSQAFAPVLAANGGGALLNVLSIVAWINGGAAGGLRGQQVGRLVADERAAPRARARRRTQVLALHMAFVDTDLVRAHRRPEDEPRRDRRPRARRARGRARRSAGRRAHAARQAGPDGAAAELPAASSPDRTPIATRTGASP